MVSAWIKTKRRGGSFVHPKKEKKTTEEGDEKNKKTPREPNRKKKISIPRKNRRFIMKKRVNK